MKLFKSISAAAFFFVGGQAFGMEMNTLVGNMIESICRQEEEINSKMWLGQELGGEKLLELKNFRESFVNLMCETQELIFPYINALLPQEKKLKDLSITQKEAVLMFESQLDKSGKVNMDMVSTYLLAGAINILTEEKDDEVSQFILNKILEKTPKEFLEGYEGE